MKKSVSFLKALGKVFSIERLSRLYSRQIWKAIIVHETLGDSKFFKRIHRILLSLMCISSKSIWRTEVILRTVKYAEKKTYLRKLVFFEMKYRKCMRKEKNTSILYVLGWSKSQSQKCFALAPNDVSDFKKFLLSFTANREYLEVAQRPWNLAFMVRNSILYRKKHTFF